jgi:hypothetical protein
MFKDLKNYIVTEKGDVINILTGKKLKTYLNKGYPSISLRNENGKKKNYLVHRIVAETFIPNPENKPFVNHIDGNSENFNVNNLEWCTQKENIFHSKKLTKNGAVISKKKIMEIYNKNTEISSKEFLELLLKNCN